MRVADDTRMWPVRLAKDLKIVSNTDAIAECIILRVLTTIGFTLPSDFPSAEYEAVHARIKEKRDKYAIPWDQYAGGWNAVAYRFLSCAEHDEAFTASVRGYGSSPSQPHRFVQEKELFGFFVTGQAALESFCYAIHAIAAMVQPASFPMGNLRELTPENTGARLRSAFVGEPLQTKVSQLTSDPDFKHWKDIRNILAHCTAPGRLFSVGSEDDTTKWLGIAIDVSTTVDRRKWLAARLRDLVIAADAFTVSHPV